MLRSIAHAPNTRGEPPTLCVLTREGVQNALLSDIQPLHSDFKFMMAIEILTKYTPELIAAFSLCGCGIHAISDLCLSGGLIAENVYRRVIDSAQSQSDIKKCEILLSALQVRVEQDGTCFESVLSVLQKVLGSQNQWVLAVEDEYYKDSTPPTKHRKTEESPAEQDLHSHSQVPEIEVICQFTPELANRCGW